MRSFCVIALSCGLLASCGEPDTFPKTTTQNLVSLMGMMRSDPNLSSFVDLLERFEIAPILLNQASLTVFAPTNQSLVNLTDIVTPQRLQCHLIAGKYPIAALTETGSGTLTSLHGVTLFYDVTPGTATLTGSSQNSRVKITAVDFVASNGIIHHVDDVLTC